MLTASACATSARPPSPPLPPRKDESFHLRPASRRQLLAALVFPVAPLLVAGEPTSTFSPVAGARGLFQMPPPRLTNSLEARTRYLLVGLPWEGISRRGQGNLRMMPPPRLTNRYFLVRAGESEYESLGIINTNPVAKTSVDSGLSEKGKKQMVRAAFDLKEMGACERNCWIWPSITQRAYQAAEIIASVNGISRSYLVPEYTFLDARGLGAYEGKNLDSVSEVYASDSISPRIKPPPIDDGTPNESVADVFVRVTQLMSILETQYSEDTVIIVSPDSDNLSVLQAGIVGLDLRRHRELSFAPGEVRFVDASSIPTYKQPASAVYKCLNPPSCT